MWDPKRLTEDRTPPPAKQPPKRRDGNLVLTTSDTDTSCTGCAKTIARGAQVARFHPKQSHIETWHRDCWHNRGFEVFAPTDPIHRARQTILEIGDRLKKQR
jgi:hypothetical protein